MMVAFKQPVDQKIVWLEKNLMVDNYLTGIYNDRTTVVYIFVHGIHIDDLPSHYSDVIMSALASQITSRTIVY